MTLVTTELKCDVASAAAARSCIEAAMRVWQLDDLSEVATLLTSELVANAVLHARTAVTVVARRCDPGVMVEVFDDSPELPVPVDAASGAEGGRGLYLVQALASRWGAEPAETGKVVWFELRPAS